jgi:hypothetical protein
MASPFDGILETMVRVIHCCLPSPLLESMREEAKLMAVEGMAEDAEKKRGRERERKEKEKSKTIISKKWTFKH